MEADFTVRNSRELDVPDLEGAVVSACHNLFIVQFVPGEDIHVAVMRFDQQLRFGFVVGSCVAYL